jgi:uncharacterized membrane protein
MFSTAFLGRFEQEITLSCAGLVGAGLSWEMSWLPQQLSPGRPNHKGNQANHRTSRLGILSMILCFALGIANIFTFRLVIIIFSAICLYALSFRPIPSSGLG